MNEIKRTIQLDRYRAARDADQPERVELLLNFLPQDISSGRMQSALERSGLRLDYVDNYELWHGAGFKDAAAALKLSEPATDPPNEEVLREVESAVFNGHSDPNCVDWDNWKFCSGLYFAVHRCERAGHTREAIKAAFYRAVALNTR